MKVYERFLLISSKNIVMILCIDNDIDKESYLDIHDFLLIKSRILCLEKLGKDIPMTFLWSKPIQPRRFFSRFFSSSPEAA